MARSSRFFIVLVGVLAIALAACSGSSSSARAALHAEVTPSPVAEAPMLETVGVTSTPVLASTVTATPVPVVPIPTPVQTPTPPSGPPPPRASGDRPAPVLGARAAVLIDSDSGAVLFDQDAHTPLPPASTTKIVTALLAVERGDLDDVVEVQLDGRAYWGSVMGLQNGDRFTLRDLLYGMMLPSGNDAAYTIAAYLAGSEPAFADMMNARMRALGLTENDFKNASGLGREGTNVISAHDLAQVARFAMRNPEFARVVGTRSYVARGSRTISFGNGNELLSRYAGADGVKIGWGGRFGGNTIVGTAVRNGHRLFVALLDTPDRAGESARLLDWGFTAFRWE